MHPAAGVNDSQEAVFNFPPNMFWPKAARSTMGRDVSTWQSFTFSDNTGDADTTKSQIFTGASSNAARAAPLKPRHLRGVGKMRGMRALLLLLPVVKQGTRGFRSRANPAKPKAKRSMTTQHTLYSLSTSSTSWFLMRWDWMVIRNDYFSWLPSFHNN